MTAQEKPARLVSLADLPAAWRGGVVAIGNFDGVHRGHQAVLNAASAEAEHLGVPCLMLTFEPHPRAFFSGRPLFRLTPAPLKAALAAALGFDGTLVLAFDKALSEQSAEDFVRQVLVERLAIRAAVTGYDFHFGKARRGTPQFLAEQGVLNGFSVTIVDALMGGSEAVSSTRIRGALAQGDAETAAGLLGWRFAVAGSVIHGDARGRELGYPTANMVLDPASELAHGIYAVRFPSRRTARSMTAWRATAGGRPSAAAIRCLRPSSSISPAISTVRRRLSRFTASSGRSSRFDSVEALVERMEQDSIDARALLERHPPSDFDRRIYAAWAGLQRA